MPSRRQQRENATEKIYTDIADHLQDYKDFTYEQKLEYIENAFNNVNNLYGTLYRSHKPNDLKFGFFVGDNPDSVANYLPFYHSIAFSLVDAFNSKNPVGVYKTIFHEFRHVRQFLSPTLRFFERSSKLYGEKHENGIVSKIISKIIPDETLANGVKWTLSGGEIGADLSARNMLSRISKYGMLKKDVESASEIKFNFFKGHFSNLKPLAPEKKKEFAIWKETSLANLFFQTTKGRKWFFNKEDISRVLKVSSLPRQEDGKVSYDSKIDFVLELGRFAKETSDFKRHDGMNFFGKFINKPHGFLYLFNHKERVFGEEKFARFDKNGNDNESYYSFKGVDQKDEDINTEENPLDIAKYFGERLGNAIHNNNETEKDGIDSNSNDKENQAKSDLPSSVTYPFDYYAKTNDLSDDVVKAFQKLESYSEANRLQEEPSPIEETK